MFKSQSIYKAESVIDLSIGSEQEAATITGSMGTWIPMAYDWVCYVRSIEPKLSNWTKKLVVDPGPTGIGIACGSFSGLVDRAAFNFEAIAGREYQVRTSPFTCPSLYDRSERVEIARQDCK